MLALKRARITTPALAVAAIVVMGCGSGPGLRLGRRAPSAEEIAEAEEYVKFGEELAVEGASRADLERALSAFERAEDLVGRSVDSMIRRARTILLIAEPITEGDDALTWAEQGLQLAEQIREQSNKRVEGHYYEAVFIGLRARQKSVPKALLLLPGMAERGRRAMEIDETYDDAGPLRLMGTLLVTAPPWPASVGDTDEGLELLWRAVEVSDYPRNRLLLVEALIEDDELEDGCRELEPLLNGEINGRWAAAAERWSTEAEELAKSGECPLPEEQETVEPADPGEP
jgi:hypothetical protein